MRTKVMDAIETLGYRPDYAARSLRKGRTDTIGFYNGYRDLMLFSDDFQRSIFMGLQDELTNLGQDLLLYNESPRSPSDVVRDIGMSKVDGVVFLPRRGDEELSVLLSESHFKVVTIVEAMPGLPAITAQDAEGAALLARHLYDRGHRHVMYRRSSDDKISPRRRWEAFASAARNLGMRITDTTTTDIFDELDENERMILRDSRERGITAVVGWHDYSAVRALLFCLRIGKKVPGDIAIAGFDKLTPLFCPKGFELTTIAVDWPEVARRGVDYLVRGKEAAVRAGGGDVLVDNDGISEIQIHCPLFIGNTT
jgi:DNA-binding LacI/PurR family transcriptional regulator